MSNGDAKIGIYVEDMIKVKIKRKALIEESAELDHVHKLDFVLNKFNEIEKFVAIGVQITTKMSDLNKMKEFINARKSSRVVDRALYIEIDPDLGKKPSGAELAYNALVCFAFQKGASLRDISGVRISNDLTYEFFNIEDKINNVLEKMNQINSVAKPENTSESNQMMANLLRYVPEKGIGYLVYGIKRWFFHISDVEDTTLSDLIKSARIGDKNLVEDEISIVFEDAGIKKSGVKYPQAIKLKLPKKS